MSSDGRFLVEDFLEALTSQLDRTQDALRLKAVNRPLTYAVRDFSLELRVFVEMGSDGHVIFRSAGPNEEGASVVSIGFTTMTRPMIEENTVSLEEVRSPSLDELGLEPDEQRQMEKIGVTNAAQLKRLTVSSDESTLARFSNVPVNRLRSALQASRPIVRRVGPAPETSQPNRGPRPGPSGSIRLPGGPGRIRIDGSNLRGSRGVPLATLDGQPIDVLAGDDLHLVVDIGELAPVGILGLDFGDEVLEVDLAGPTGGAGADPWSPA